MAAEREESPTPSNGRGFWALIATQFQGAFNDNLYRFIIGFYMIHLFAPAADEALRQAFTMKILALCTVLFAVPFLAFPGLAGALADRYSKRTVAIATKLWEVLVMIVALVAFHLGAPALIFFLLFMMFTQSAFFSPAKYGMLPEIFPEARLSWGNGILNGTTYVAIIAGQAVAGLLYEQVRKGTIGLQMVSLLLIILSCVGVGFSLGITRVKAANPARGIPINPWSGLGKYFRLFYGDRVLWLTLLGASYFWFAGAIAQVNVMNHGLTTLGVTESWASLLSVSVLIGIGLGSLGAGRFSGDKIELGLIPLGLAGMTICGFLLGASDFSYRSVCVLALLLGFSGGFFIVPLMATVQHRSPEDVKGGMIATFNIGTSLAVLLGAACYGLAGVLHLTTQHVFLIVAALTALTGTYLCLALPTFVLRSVLWLFANTLYRVKVVGRMNVPEKGGALLVANHTSFVDALFLTAALDRPVRFLVSSEMYESWWIRPWAKVMRAIPISAMDNPRDLLRSLHEASDAIRSGELVCIFAEGQITRTGQMLPFQKGYERIMKGVDAPIVPVHLDRLWGSVFSYSEGRFFWKWPKQIPYPVTVTLGSPMPADTTPFALRTAIRELGTEAYSQRRLAQPLLHRAFIRNARRHPLRKAIADATIPFMSYGKALIASIVFGRKLNQVLDEQEMVGVLLPPTVGAVLTNIALQLMGRVPVNLNYTASAEGMRAAAQRCGITYVITAKAFLEKLPLKVPGKPVYLEDVKDSVNKSDRIGALLLAVFAPIRLLERALGCKRARTQDDLATVIFSSGSEGEPKGVALTHFNISSNIESPLQLFPHDYRDSVIGFLPFFHSFGFTGTLWLPLTRGFSGVYYPSPLEAKTIGRLIYEHKCTFLIAAPTFLQNFIRRCLPEELSSVRYCITGAEKLPARLREAFREKFGIEPLEGYGTTECAPIVSVNVPDFRAPGYYQVGTRHGTIGQPIPGVSVRVVDPDTGELLPENVPGVLLVKGPNIMKGYLGMPERTAQVLKDGWYWTGDIASIDEDGFITITDRLSRFSKIGGEMVPHTHIEEVLHRLLGLTEVAFAVTGVPDETKGERLVVLHTLDDGQLEVVLGKLDQSGLPNLWLPKPTAFYRVSEIPVLATGKVNLREVKGLAKRLDVGTE